MQAVVADRQPQLFEVLYHRIGPQVSQAVAVGCVAPVGELASIVVQGVDLALVVWGEVRSDRGRQVRFAGQRVAGPDPPRIESDEVIGGHRLLVESEAVLDVRHTRPAGPTRVHEDGRGIGAGPVGGGDPDEGDVDRLAGRRRVVQRDCHRAALQARSAARPGDRCDGEGLGGRRRPCGGSRGGGAGPVVGLDLAVGVSLVGPARRDRALVDG